jgi:siroheme synthase
MEALRTPSLIADTTPTTPEERSVIDTLEELPVLATAAGIGPPATLVVGAVASIPVEAAALAAPLAQLDPP